MVATASLEKTVTNPANPVHAGGAVELLYVAVVIDSPTRVSPDARARARQLHGQGLGSKRIARILDHDGIPAPRGGRWNASTVWRIVSADTPAEALYTWQWFCHRCESKSFATFASASEADRYGARHISEHCPAVAR